MEHSLIGNEIIPILGLGTFGMHGDVLINTVKCAQECGCSLFDTAFRYENERELGEILLNKDAILSTKLSGRQYCGNKKWLHLNRLSAKKAYLYSCARIGRNTLDLYMLHSPFRKFEKAYKELIKLQKDGLVHTIGVSGFNEERLKKIKSYCGEYPQFNMIEHHPYFPQKRLVQFCQDNCIPVIARSPFAHGEILPELSENETICGICRKYSKTVPQIILRWITQKGIIAVFRSTHPEHIRDNFDIFDFSLDDNEMDYLDGLDKGHSYGVISSGNNNAK